METESSRVGVLCVTMAALLFSLGGLFIKELSSWSAMSVNGARCAISIFIIGAYMLITKHRLRINRPVIVGSVSMAGTMMLFTFANKLTSAANTIILQFTAPVFVIVFMLLIFKKKPDKLDIAACAVVFAGIVIFFVDSLSTGGMIGNILALLSGVSYAGVFMLNAAKDADPISSVFLGQLFCAVCGVPFVFAETDFSPRTLLFVAGLGILQLGIAYIFFTEGVKRISPIAASLATGIEPVLNPVWVAVFFGEGMSATAVFGGVAVVGAVVVYNVIKARKRT